MTSGDEAMTRNRDGLVLEAATTTTTSSSSSSSAATMDVSPSRSSSSSSSPAASRDPSSNDLRGLAVKAKIVRRKTLEERRRIPASLYMSVGLILSLQYFAGLWTLQSIYSLASSVHQSSLTLHSLLQYSRDLTRAFFAGEIQDWKEFLKAVITISISGSLLYIFVVAPFRAGLWTGPRSRHHMLHRYMGLFFMAQYLLATVEFFTNYETAGKNSLLPHTIALNGCLQTWSAFFSFKVLPELNDAGYYSDKAVLSRNFVHENGFFQVFVVFGSVYYIQDARETLRSTTMGRLLEYLFVFWPYVVIRPFFPITRFKNAGTTMNGRTARNQKFYEWATVLVKIFYLWAKYFLGFYLNFLVFLDKTTPQIDALIDGLFLLNVGTISLAMFLHTLRFRKVHPPRLTFTLYLVQIYATFSAIPAAVVMFCSHPKLCMLTFAGLLCNMTRSRAVHAVWCLVVMVLLTTKYVEW